MKPHVNGSTAQFTPVCYPHCYYIPVFDISGFSSGIFYCMWEDYVILNLKKGVKIEHSYFIGC